MGLHKDVHHYLCSPRWVGSSSSSLALVSRVGEAGDRVSSSLRAQPRQVSSGECEVDIPESGSPRGSGSRPMPATMLSSMSGGTPGGGGGTLASDPGSLGPLQLGVAALSSSNIEAEAKPSRAENKVYEALSIFSHHG